jgi:hypothetical protein
VNSSSTLELQKPSAESEGAVAVGLHPVVSPRLLDLFCCAGGAGEGYRRAGFDVTGVDIEVDISGYCVLLPSDEYTEKNQGPTGGVGCLLRMQNSTMGASPKRKSTKQDMCGVQKQGQREFTTSFRGQASWLARRSAQNTLRLYDGLDFTNRSDGRNARQKGACL